MKEKKLNQKDFVEGDTFALEIKNTTDQDLLGKYFILTKLERKDWEDDQKQSIFRVKLTKNHSLPKTEQELNDLEYVQTDCIIYEDRYTACDGSVPKEIQIQRRKKVEFYPDEFGFLYVYQIRLEAYPRNTLPKNLIYLGNFKLTPPEKEYIPYEKHRLKYYFWTQAENVLIKCYQIFNRKSPTIFCSETAESMRRDFWINEIALKEVKEELKNKKEEKKWWQRDYNHIQKL